jgi:hypothetical protein
LPEEIAKNTTKITFENYRMWIIQQNPGVFPRNHTEKDKEEENRKIHES